MEKILPIVKPVVSSYPRYGHTFSVLGAYTQEYLPWIYMYFAQLYAPDELSGEGQLDYVAPDIYAKIPWLEINYMEIDIGFKKMNGMQLMKEYINCRYSEGVDIAICTKQINNAVICNHDGQVFLLY